MPKKPKPKVVRTPTKHQLTRWEKEKRVTRFFLIIAAVIVALVVAIPAIGYYREVFAKGREAIATVNGKSFTMDSYTRQLNLREYQMDAFLSSFSQQSGNTG
ncbi:MAG: hypothetical protein Q7O66_10755, partial [Dehalococcoidia bacterium]|nr:hypothetical protein [Dehalococcoidia bacterium]